jgi:16S rRNA (guanine966-N2)-methyltransferase
MPGAGRVIAGTARGLRLVGPDEGARPLGDRVKEALFAILEPDLRGRFLDLFAGSGAGGIEALSRGAERAVFVDRDPAAIRAVERNLVATRLAGQRAVVVRRDALQWLREGAAVAGPFGAILLDPPYDEPGLLTAALESIAAAGPDTILAAGGVVASKHASSRGPAAAIGLLGSVRERRFGETGLTLHRWVTGAATAPDEEAG